MTALDEIHRLLDQAASPDSTGPEAIAALSAAARLGVRVIGAPEGYEWRDGRLVAEASSLPALHRRVLSWRNPNEALQPEEPDEEPVPEPDVAPQRNERVQPGVRNKPGNANRTLIAAMLDRPQGATLQELCSATGMQELTVRVRVSQLRSEGLTSAVWSRSEKRFVPR